MSFWRRKNRDTRTRQPGTRLAGLKSTRSPQYISCWREQLPLSGPVFSYMQNMFQVRQRISDTASQSEKIPAEKEPDKDLVLHKLQLQMEQVQMESPDEGLHRIPVILFNCFRFWLLYRRIEKALNAVRAKSAIATKRPPTVENVTKKCWPKRLL